MNIRDFVKTASKHAASGLAGAFACHIFLAKKRSLVSYTDFLAQVYGTGMCLLPLVKRKYNAVIREMNVDATIDIDAEMNSIEMIWTNKTVLEGVKALMQDPVIEEMYN